MNHYVVLHKMEYPPIHIEADGHTAGQESLTFVQNSDEKGKTRFVATFKKDDVFAVIDHDYLIGQPKDAAEQANSAINGK